MGRHKSGNLIPFNEISCVFWKDAYVTTDDDPKLDHDNDLTISIGVIVKENDKEIIISSFYDGISLTFASPFQVIPRGMIKEIKKVRVCTKKTTTK